MNQPCTHSFASRQWAGWIGEFGLYCDDDLKESTNVVPLKNTGDIFYGQNEITSTRYHRVLIKKI